MNTPIARRTALIGIGGITIGTLAACSAATAPATTPSGTPSAAAAPTTEVAADFTTDDMFAVPANPSFAFADALSGDTGDAASVTADYYLARTLVTNAQYALFLAATGTAAPGYWTDGVFPTGKDAHPVIAVSATDATSYCAWLTAANDGWSFRLPTEAEWENAARGTTTDDYPWANDAGTRYDGVTLTSAYNYNAVVSAFALAEHGSDTVSYTDRSGLAGTSVVLSSILSVGSDGGVNGWIDHDNNTGFVFTDLYADLSAEGGYTTAVGAYPDGAGPYGQLDLAGNAWEWTSSAITAGNGAEAGKQVTAVRGGSWYATGRSCRTTYRGEGRDPSGGYNTVGFRVAADSL